MSTIIKKKISLLQDECVPPLLNKPKGEQNSKEGELIFSNKLNERKQSERQKNAIRKRDGRGSYNQNL